MGRLLLAWLLACAGCIDWDSLYDPSADAGGVDAEPPPDVEPGVVGCSDGSAEVLIADRGLAGCDGAWSIPGVVSATEPACDRAAGNDGTRSSGEGCAAADLCADGWHVCQDADEVSARGGDSACEAFAAPPDPEGTTAFIYLSRQRATGDDPACLPDGSEEAIDDAWGCGTRGLEAPDCRPLDRHLALEVEGGGCESPWSCGEDPRAEGQNVTKLEPSQGGGVLCCSDLAP